MNMAMYCTALCNQNHDFEKHSAVYRHESDDSECALDCRGTETLAQCLTRGQRGRWLLPCTVWSLELCGRTAFISGEAKGICGVARREKKKNPP